MSIVGIVVAKENSNRFPNKNIHSVNNIPLFWYSVNPMLESNKIDKVYVATNSVYIRDYCKETCVDVIWRGPNISYDDQSLFDVIKYSYLTINKKYDIIVNIMANSIGHSLDDVNKAINKFEKYKLKELRSYDKNGLENGLIILDEQYLMTKNEISSYVGMITSNAIEIHVEKDLEGFNG